MAKIEIVKKIMSLIEEGKFIEVKMFLADNFAFSGPVPVPVRASDWLMLHEKINEGMPDFKFNLKKLSESGNIVNGSVQITGTHTQEMPELVPGTLNIPPTYKKVILPEENVTFTFKGNQVSAFTVERVPNGGVPGLLKQLGVSMPTMK